jgi:hypothetical protein
MPQNATHTGDSLTCKTASHPVTTLDFLTSRIRDISDNRYMLFPDFVSFTRNLTHSFSWMTQTLYRRWSRISSNYRGIFLGSPSDLHLKLHFLPGNVFPASCISPCREKTGKVFLSPLLPSRFRFPLMHSYSFIKTNSL